MASTKHTVPTVHSSRTVVYLVLLPGTLLLDLAGVAEPLRLANRFAIERGDAAPFELRVVGPPQAVQSSLPIQLTGHTPLPKQIDPHAWIVIVGIATKPAVSAATLAQERAATRKWLQASVAPAIGRNEARLFTVCSGALTAADAGLLDGRRCTTHHELIEELKQHHPRALVEEDRIFVIDGPIATSAGITAGIDLALAAIHERCGPALASAVARDLVMYWRRAGGDPQLSPLVDHRNHLHPAVHRAQDAIIAHPQAQWDADSIAAAAFVSQRHIRRLFTDHANITPIAYVNRIRTALARQILQNEANVSVERVAERVGFGSARHLREAWRREAWPQPPRQFSRLRGTSSRTGDQREDQQRTLAQGEHAEC